MSPSPVTRKKKILIVEDHTLFRAMLAQLVEQELGMTVCGQASQLQDALKIIEKAKPDAAIVDLTLAGPGGLELIKETKARRIPLPVLVLSMHDEKLYAERALRAGAQGYISKAQPPEEVATTVDSYRARIKQKLALKNAAELYQRSALWVAGSASL